MEGVRFHFALSSTVLTDTDSLPQDGHHMDDDSTEYETDGSDEWWQDL